MAGRQIGSKARSRYKIGSDPLGERLSSIFAVQNSRNDDVLNRLADRSNPKDAPLDRQVAGGGVGRPCVQVAAGRGDASVAEGGLHQVDGALIFQGVSRWHARGRAIGAGNVRHGATPRQHRTRAGRAQLRRSGATSSLICFRIWPGRDPTNRRSSSSSCSPGLNAAPYNSPYSESNAYSRTYSQ